MIYWMSKKDRIGDDYNNREFERDSDREAWVRSVTCYIEEYKERIGKRGLTDRQLAGLQCSEFWL